MARQKGIIKLTGTLGDVNFYTVNGVSYARMAGGGFNGYAIRNKPSMQRVRENASEFGHCSRVKKAFRLALLPFLEGTRDKSLHARMMGLFTRIKQYDAVSVRGERRVGAGLQTAKGRRLLLDFDLTPQHPMLEGLTDHALFDWDTQGLQVRDFNPSLFKAPTAATHVGVTLGVLDFDFEALDSQLAVSPTHILEVGAGASSFDLIPDTVVVPEHVGVAVIGIRFYEYLEGELYDLDTQVGVGLVAVRVS